MGKNSVFSTLKEIAINDFDGSVDKLLRELFPDTPLIHVDRATFVERLHQYQDSRCIEVGSIVKRIIGSDGDCIVGVVTRVTENFLGNTTVSVMWGDGTLSDNVDTDRMFVVSRKSSLPILLGEISACNDKILLKEVAKYNAK